MPTYGVGRFCNLCWPQLLAMPSAKGAPLFLILRLIRPLIKGVAAGSMINCSMNNCSS